MARTVPAALLRPPRASTRAGDPEAALRLLTGRPGWTSASTWNERGRNSFVARSCSRSIVGVTLPPLLLKAAKELELLDPGLARETYLEAFAAALFADRLARGGGVHEVAEAILSADWRASSQRAPRAFDHLLDGMAVLATQGYAAAAPILKQALAAFRDEPMADEEALRWLWLACRVARAMGDDAAWDELTDRHVQLARSAGALSVLPIALAERFSVQLFVGDLIAAAALMAETEALVDATGSHLAPQGAISLAAWQGRDEEATRLIDASRDAVENRGEGLWLTSTEWTKAVLYNSLGRYEEALSAAETAAEHPHELGVSTWVPTELIEAAARTGQIDRAVRARSNDSMRSARQAGPTGHWESRPARERSCPRESTPSASISRRSSDLDERDSACPRPRSTPVWRVAATGAASGGGAGTAAGRPSGVFGDGDGGFRGACKARADGNWREGSQEESRRRRGIHPAGGPDREARQRRPDQPRNRSADVPQSENRGVASAQGVQQARHQLAAGTRRGAPKPRARIVPP